MQISGCAIMVHHQAQACMNPNNTSQHTVTLTLTIFKFKKEMFSSKFLSIFFFMLACIRPGAQ